MSINPTTLPAFRWMRGMRLIDTATNATGTVTEGDSTYVIWQGEGATTDGGGWHEDCPPRASLAVDAEDPATLGCLLQMVREAWGDPSMSLYAVDEAIPTRWQWAENGLTAPALDWHMDTLEWESEFDALVAALAAAPLKP